MARGSGGGRSFGGRSGVGGSRNSGNSGGVAPAVDDAQELEKKYKGVDTDASVEAELQEMKSQLGLDQ